MNGKAIQDSLEKLMAAGWTIKVKVVPDLNLKESFNDRFPNVPDDYKFFLSKIERCVNPSDNAWFLCEEDFNEAADSAFRWNEWEQIGIEAANADNDLDMANHVRAFWDEHLPCLMSVKNGYSYAAICLSPVNFGKVVFGAEPEFEEAEIVASTFSELLDILVTASTKRESLPAWIYNFV